MTPRISVLLPTRGRVNNLMMSVDSLYALAADRSTIEVVARCDDDDIETISVLQRVLPKESSTIIVGPRWGYRRMHDYYNQLAAAAKGDFLLIWNDDTEMLTQNWDRLLCNAPPFSVQFLRRDILDVADITFPVVSRSVYETFGYLAKNAHVDLWLGEIALGAGDVHESVAGANIGILRNDIVFHHYRLNDQTSIERDMNYDMVGFSSESMKETRAADVGRLLVKKDAS